MTCVGGSKAPPIPLLPILYERTVMANIERSIWKLLNDDVIPVLVHPVLWHGNGLLALESHNKTHNVHLEFNT